MELHSPFGIVAGNGAFPLQIAAEAKNRGLDVVVLAHIGETDPKISDYSSKVTWIKVGQLGKIIKALTKAGVREVVFSGGISRVKLFGGFWPDFKALSVIASTGSVRDDVILRAVAKEIEKLSIQVVSPSLLLPQCIAQEGILTKRGLTEKERKDGKFGWKVAKSIGALDIGQTVVIADGLVVAVECVEGTDRTIIRAGELTNSQSSTVVKVSKPQQDSRLDLPSIGLKTIESMKQARASALILEDKKTLILEPDEVIASANKDGIAVVVVKDENGI